MLVCVCKLPVELLVDSGSTYTLLDKTIYDQIKPQNKPPLKPSSLSLTAANGEKLKVYGETVFDFDIDDFSYQCPIKVVSLGNLNAILGTDFLEEFDCMFRVGRGILEIGRRPVTLHRKDTITRCARVSVAKTVHIGPEQEVVIEGH